MVQIDGAVLSHFPSLGSLSPTPSTAILILQGMKPGEDTPVIRGLDVQSPLPSCATQYFNPLCTAVSAMLPLCVTLVVALVTTEKLVMA